MKYSYKIIICILLTILMVTWCVCIYKLSDMNTQKSNGKSTDILAIFIEDTLSVTNDYGITNSHPTDNKLARASQLINPVMRKVAHAFVYFVLAFILSLLLNLLTNNKHFWISFFIAFILCFLYAMSDEYHQMFVPGRTSRFTDVIIDSTGALVGLLFFGTYHLVYLFGKRDKKIEIEESKKIKDLD